VQLHVDVLLYAKLCRLFKELFKTQEALWQSESSKAPLRQILGTSCFEFDFASAHASLSPQQPYLSRHCR
jgi:hypothetical protein